MHETNWKENAKWLVGEFLKVFHNPIGVFGGFTDAFRGWKFSRSWVRFWFHFPSVLILVAIFVAFGFSLLGREDTRIQSLLAEGEKHYSTGDLETSIDRNVEADFCKAAGLVPIEWNESSRKPLTKLTIRFVELLSKRILSIRPDNPFAYYRLGLIHSLTGKREEALSEMTQLASGSLGEWPQANAWLAKDLLRRRCVGDEIADNEIIKQLEKASKWRDVDPRLKTLHSRMLEDAGDNDGAIAVAKQAVVSRPELNVELARLYSRIGNQDELRAAANAAEDYFIKRINSPGEKESDRLAISEVRKLTNRLDAAAEILADSLDRKKGGAASRRELSEVQLMIFRKSIYSTAAGVYRADLSILEKAAETDSLNPSVSAAIAGLLKMKLKPTDKLREYLKSHRDKDITSSTTHLLLGDALYAMGNQKEASKNWEQAISKDPKNISAMNNLALVWAKSDPTKIDKSLAMLDKALAISPENSELLDSLGDVLALAKREKEAIVKYEQSLSVEQTRIETMRKLKKLFQSQGREDKAKAMTKRIEAVERQKEEQSKELLGGSIP